MPLLLRHESRAMIDEIETLLPEDHFEGDAVAHEFEWNNRKSQGTFHQFPSWEQSAVRLYFLERVSWHVTSATGPLPATQKIGD